MSNLINFDQMVQDAQILKETDLQSQLSSLPTVSSRIRYLNSIGTKRTEIALILNIRYQHVRNVLTQILKTPT